MMRAGPLTLNTLALLGAIGLGFEGGAALSMVANPPGVSVRRAPRPAAPEPEVRPAPAKLEVPAKPEVPSTPPPSPAPHTQAPARAPEWLERAVCARVDMDAPCAQLALAIHDESAAARLDPVLVLAVIEVESSWDASAVSPAGAHGLMQLRHGTFRQAARSGRLGSNDLHQPEANVRAGIRYLGRLRRTFRKTDLALVAYNAGPHRLSRYLKEDGGVPPHLEVYPKRVHRVERALRKTLKPAPARSVATRERRPKARRG